MNIIDTDPAAVRDKLNKMIDAANGGVMPDTFDIVTVGADTATDTNLPMDRNRLLIEIDADGRLSVDIVVATHWKALHHPGHRFARTPGGRLVLLGSHRGRRMHFWFEDDRLMCDLGSPLLSIVQEHDAMAAFDSEFADLMAEIA